jgi:hypothetical protein
METLYKLIIELYHEPRDVGLTPRRQRRPPREVGVLKYHDIRGSKLALDAVVSGLFGVSSPPSPEVALRRAEETKFEKYSEGLRSRLDIRLIPFAVT